MARKKREYETVVKMLPVVLADEEIQERGEKLAQLEEELQYVNGEAAADAARHRVQKKSLGEKIAKVAKEITDKSATMQVTCDLRPDFARNVMEIVRQDTDKVVDQRALTAEERQLELGKGKKAGPAEEAAAELPHEAPKPRRKRRARPVEAANGVAEEEAPSSL